MLTPGFVNEKTIDGVTYQAFRLRLEGAIVEWILCDGRESRCRLREVWNDPAKLKALFEGAV